ncbi:hypothetical protein [Streptomyces sp. NPDC101150]|uniref:hypothetical protein n=1 Tax=Streptomyces sp. NPDC101150 TaxID=3366114 RepID=UPI00382AB903
MQSQIILLCPKLKPREKMKPEDLIKPSETAEFGNQMCGWISAVRNKSGLGPLPNHSTIHVMDGEDELFFMYDGGAGSRSHQLRRTLDLTGVDPREAWMTARSAYIAPSIAHGERDQRFV